MGLTRLPLSTTMFALLVLSGLAAAWAGDSTFGPPELGAPNMSSRRTAAQPPVSQLKANRAAQSQDANSRTHRASYQTPETPFAPSEELPGTPEPDSGPTLDSQSMDEELSPIPQPDDLDYDMIPYGPPAPTLSSGKWFDRGCWYSREEVTFLQRFEHRDTHLATDFSAGVPAARRMHLSTSRDLNFAPGARLTIGRFLGRDPMNRQSAIEFTFYGLNNWSQTRGLQSFSPNSLFTDFDPVGNLAPGFDRANFMQYTYAARFNSYELNLRLSRRLSRDRMVLTRDGTWERNLAPTILPTLIAGLRLVTLNESLQWTSQGTNPATLFGQYNVRTHNSLVGIQFGTDFTFQQANWNAGIRIKGGPFINYADQTTFVHQFDATAPSNPADRNQGAQNTPLALVSEINMQGAYYFRPNMALRMSYDMLFLTDLALADKQITFAQMGSHFISTTHGLILTGVTVGCEFNW